MNLSESEQTLKERNGGVWERRERKGVAWPVYLASKRDLIVLSLGFGHSD